MNETIRKLYSGELVEYENTGCTKPNKARNERLNKLDRLLRELEKSLSEEQKKIFQEWQGLDTDNWLEENEHAYIRGFKVGTMLAIEAHQVDDIN